MERRKLPKRTREHELEDESKKQFLTVIPSSWIFNEPTSRFEYGVDGSIELSKNGDVTGEEFKLQFKGTDSESEPTSVQLDISTFNYYLDISRTTPILMVLYHSKSKNIYAKWFHDFDPYYDKSGKKANRRKNSNTISFYWNQNDIWIDTTTQRIEQDVTLFRKIKNHQIIPPFKFFIDRNIEQTNAIAISSIFTALNLKIKNTELFEFVFTKDDDCIGVIEFKENEVKCNFFNNTGMIVHLAEEQIKDKNSMINLIILLLIKALNNIDFYQCSILLCPFLLESLEVFENDMFRDLYLHTIVYNKNWLLLGKFLINFNKHLNDLDIEPIEKLPLRILIMTIMIEYSDKLYAEDLDKVSLDNIEKHIKENDKTALSACYYSLGNRYRQENARLALKYYNLARKEDNNYNNQVYFIQELAGILFMLKRFNFSANLYKKVYKETKDFSILPLYADALLYGGNYYKSLKVLGLYINLAEKNKVIANSEWLLKHLAIDFMIKEMNIKKQNRTPQNKSSIELVMGHELEEAQLEDLTEFFNKDLLSDTLWFYYAINVLNTDSEKFIPALICSAIFDLNFHSLALAFINCCINEDKDYWVIADIIMDFSVQKDDFKLFHCIENIVMEEEKITNKEDFLTFCYKKMQEKKAKIKEEPKRIRLYFDEEIPPIEIKF